MSAMFAPCSDEPDLIELTNVVITPDPPTVRLPVTETWTFNSRCVVTPGARLHELWTVGGMTIVDREVDVCDMAAKAGVSCPIEPGARTLTFTHAWGDDPPPPIPPFVSIDVRRTIVNGDGSQLLCYTMVLKFMP